MKISGVNTGSTVGSALRRKSQIYREGMSLLFTWPLTDSVYPGYFTLKSLMTNFNVDCLQWS